MKPALLLLNLREGPLERRGLVPRRSALVEHAQRLLHACRQIGTPVVHVRTRMSSEGAPCGGAAGDGSQAGDEPAAAAFPAGLLPHAGELSVMTRSFCSLSDPQVAASLADGKVDLLIVAGVDLFESVRSVVLDGCDRGCEVWVADQAVGSVEPGQDALTRSYLDGRLARFLDTSQILERLASREWQPPDSSAAVAGAWIAGRPASADPRTFERRNPSNWSEVLARVGFASAAEVTQAAETACEAHRAWRCMRPSRRALFLDAWAEGLATRQTELSQLIALETGKPIADAREEIARAVAHVRAASQLFGSDLAEPIVADGPVRARFHPRGVVGLVTPWNNPVAIPVGKLAPALALGNGALWKPAIEAPRAALVVMETLRDAEFPAGLVNLVFGEAATARQVIEQPAVAAISLTGSLDTGRAAAALCARRAKPLQADLGGNNAAIVLRECDLPETARGLARAAFSCAGQRCTAIRRIIVDRVIAKDFAGALCKAVAALRLGQPLDEPTEIGPVVSRGHAQWIVSRLERAAARGARVLCGGSPPAGYEQGCWLSPALVAGVDSRSELAQTETFGPVAAILECDDLDEALTIANSVEQGLVAALCGGDGAQRRRFCAAIEAGIVKLTPGPLQIHALAPFGGWKASQSGPPEHGRWDLEFYSRPQAVYGWEEE
jgi:acyl-CoA reductase-like NAD-dependent aldehyde dehydrogenase/nicotinamidase-related amidase